MIKMDSESNVPTEVPTESQPQPQQEQEQEEQQPQVKDDNNDDTVQSSPASGFSITVVEDVVDIGGGGTSASASASSTSRPPTKTFDIRINYADMQGFVIESRSKEDGTTHKVIRNYDHFIQLQQHLAANYSNQIGPIIHPPLPESFAPAEKQITAIHRDISQSCGIQLMNVPEFGLYLNSLLIHPVLGKDPHLNYFLTEHMLSWPVGSSLPAKKQSVFSALFSTATGGGGSSGGSKSSKNIRDTDEFYEDERYFITSYETNFMIMKNAILSWLVNNRKFCNVLGHFSTCITSTLIINDPQSQAIAFNKSMCQALDKYKDHLEVQAAFAYQTLGVQMQYMHAHIEAYKQLLSHRIDLLVKYENANKALQRNTDSNRACEEKQTTEREFNEYSEKGRGEVKLFHRNRSENFLQSIHEYINTQVTVSRQTVRMLKECITSLKSNA